MIGFSHLGICVSDLDRSVAFYTQGLGGEELNIIEMDKYLPPNYRELLETPADTRGFSKFVVLDGLLLELLYYTRQDKPGGHVGPSDRRPMNQLGITHLGLRVPVADEFRALPAKIREFGGEVIEKTRLILGEFEGQRCESVFATDPDGTRVELMYIPDNYPIGDIKYRPRTIERI